MKKVELLTSQQIANFAVNRTIINDRTRDLLRATLKIMIDQLINSVKEECAMIFENQISDENTDKANTNLSLNAKAIRDKI